jgi:predicted lipid-binding transport protein (Tim44 family)
VAWIDLVIIGLVLALVVSRFFSFKLPTDLRDKATRKAEFEQLFGRRKPGQPGPREAYQESQPEEGVAAADAEEAVATKPATRRKATPTARDVAHLEGLEQIKALDGNFDRAEFVGGAIAAYMYFYDYYNARDQEGIINLCGPQFEQQVMAEWEENPAKVVVEAEPKASIQSARLNGRTAILEVAFTGTHRLGKAAPKPVRSVWVFARALGSPDPNWELQTIQPQADA